MRKVLEASALYTDLGQPIMKVHRVLSCMHTTQFQIKLAIFCHIYTDFFQFADIKDLVAKADTDGDGKVSFGGKFKN